MAVVLVEVVAPVSVEPSGLAVRAFPQAPDGWNCVQQWQELGDVVSAAAGERDVSEVPWGSTIRWCLEPGWARSPSAASPHLRREGPYTGPSAGGGLSPPGQ